MLEFLPWYGVEKFQTGEAMGSMLYMDSLLVHLSVDFCVESMFFFLIMFHYEHSRVAAIELSSKY